MIWVVLPAFNEAGAIGSLLTRLAEVRQRHQLPLRLLVVDDGSTDQTADAVRGHQGVPVALATHPENRGLAEALRTGLTTALRQAGDEAIIVTMDADNTHDPSLIPQMISVINHGFDVVIASRYQPGVRLVGLPWHRRLLSRGASGLFRWLRPIPGVRDYTSGYRAYRVGPLRQVFDQWGSQMLRQSGFACMAELLFRLQRVQATMAEVPLILRYDQKVGRSKLPVRRTIQETLGLLLGPRGSW